MALICFLVFDLRKSRYTRHETNARTFGAPRRPSDEINHCETDTCPGTIFLSEVTDNLYWSGPTIFKPIDCARVLTK